MDGLGSFIKADDHRAVDVVHLRQGAKPLHVRKSQFSEAFPEATIREGADELTLRADEVEHCGPSSTQTTLSLKDRDRRWLMRTGMPSAKQSTKELQEKNGKSCIVTTERRVRQQELKAE